VELDLLTEEGRPQHLAQAKYYAYFYMLQEDIKSMEVHLKYIHVLTYETRTFKKKYNRSQLQKYFDKSIGKYLDWHISLINQNKYFMEHIDSLEFPFEFRKNQRELMGAVYKTILDKGICYAIAPTGTGKTIATLFSSLKTYKEKDKIMYLTAKNSLKRMALDTVKLLNEQDLKCKAIEITSKDHICFLEERDCDPDVCPYAKGFFDRLNDAVTDAFFNEDVFTREIVEDYAYKHKICPFEFSLMMSYFMNVVIADYNYAFDPKIHLKRYFDIPEYNMKLLVDEAHNLVSRGKSMYSAELFAADLLDLKKELALNTKKFSKHINKLINHFEGDQVLRVLPEDLLNDFYSLHSKLNKYMLDEQDLLNMKQIVEYYFILNDFDRIIPYFGEQYRLIITNHKIVLNCLDASKYLHETMNYCKGTTLFSATMFPLEYYKTLLSEGEGEHIIIPSPFKQENLDIIVVDNISTRYKDRQNTLTDIVDIIETATKKEGNYIVFFPSYKYLEDVYNLMEPRDEILVQEREMSLKRRAEFIDRFKNENNLTGMFVMGGIFSEGIDYVGDMLDGVIIVGVGLPMISKENNLLKEYFDEQFNKGFDYAYTYPGINKVIQAVGRVIRTETDRGIAVLIDDRFSTHKYMRLFPKEWRHFNVLNNKRHIEIELRSFWNEDNN
jgi:DNA excision repair protein ERCC-2